MTGCGSTLYNLNSVNCLFLLLDEKMGALSLVGHVSKLLNVKKMKHWIRLKVDTKEKLIYNIYVNYVQYINYNVIVTFKDK